MSSASDTAAKVAFIANTTASNASAVVTITAPSQSTLHTVYVTGIMISSSGIVGAAVEATLSGVMKGDGTAITVKWEIPASAFAPLSFALGPHPLKGVPGTDVVLTLPALGSGITGAATLLYYIGTI